MKYNREGAKARRKAAKATSGGIVNTFEFRERGLSGVDDRTEEVAQRAIGAMIEVHKHLGPGLLEIAYKRALVHELRLQGMTCQTEVPVPILYKGQLVADGRLDILVESVLIIEAKVVQVMHDVHRAQLLAHLKATRLQLGLLANFNVVMMRDGFKRVINTE